MKILNPLKGDLKNKKPRKKNRTQEFVENLEDKIFTQAEASPPTSGTEILKSDALGLTNVSVRKKVVEYLPTVEKIKTLIHQGRTLSQAMSECNIPDTLETRKALGKALELDLIIEFRSSPEIEKMVVQAARMKFLREAVLRGDSKDALRWATIIQDDSDVFQKQKEIPAVFMNKEDLANFLDKETTEDAIEADFELILEKASEGERKDE